MAIHYQLGYTIFYGRTLTESMHLWPMGRPRAIREMRRTAYKFQLPLHPSCHIAGPYCVTTPLLPEHRTHHPLGTHRKRVDNRAAMNAIFFVLRTRCQWNALNATGICSSSSAHRRFQEWRDAGVFERFWQNGLLACEQLDAIDWSWLSMDGCMTKSPLAGSKKQVAILLTGVSRA